MQDFTLLEWYYIVEIIGVSSIVGGLIFGFFQISSIRQQQRDAVATNLTQTFYSRDLAQALALLQELPDNLSLDAINQRGRKYHEAAVTVTTSFETMGLLVFKHIAPFSLVFDLAGGIISVMDKKLKQWQMDVRQIQNQPSWGEWFEWLSDRIKEKQKNSPPAYIIHCDWQD